MSSVVPPMSPKEARQLLAFFAKEYGVEPRIVQDEAERARMQERDKSGHIWHVGEEYIAVQDVKAAVNGRRLAK